MRILILGPAAFGQDRAGLLNMVRDTGGPHDLFTCPHLAQAMRYLTALPFDLVLAGGPEGAATIRWMETNQAALLRVPRIWAYDDVARDVTSVLPVERGGISPELVQQLVAQRRVLMGVFVPFEVLKTLRGYGDQARQILGETQLRLDALNEQKRQEGEAALKTLGFGPAARDYAIDEESGEVIEMQ